MSDIVKKATRDGFGDEIVELGRENSDVLVVDVDIGKSCKTGAFRKELPAQYLNVGIAEQNAAGVAAGLATCGKIPFVVTYAAFGSMRMVEMIRQEACYPHLNVKLACSHGGVTPANDGASHQCIEDLGILSTIPNMTVIMPADYHAARKLVRAAASWDGPVYLRFTRDAIPVIYDADDEFEIGKAKQLRDGSDAAIIANGDTVCLALAAAEALAARGVNARVLDMHTIKPLDTEAVAACRQRLRQGRHRRGPQHHQRPGRRRLLRRRRDGQGQVKRIGIQDQFGQSAPYERLLAMNGITVENIVESVLGMVK